MTPEWKEKLHRAIDDVFAEMEKMSNEEFFDIISKNDDSIDLDEYPIIPEVSTHWKWIAKDKDGDIYLYVDKPSIRDYIWGLSIANVYNNRSNFCRTYLFDDLKYIPWQESLHQVTSVDDILTIKK